MKKLATVLMALGIGFIALAPAANATGGGKSAEVGATINADGTVTVESTKDLSRVTVVVCIDGELELGYLNEDAPGKEFTFEVDGKVVAVFVHSGNNTTEDAEELLAELLGDDAVKGNSTGAVAYEDLECEKEEVPPTTTTTQPPTTTTTEPPATTTTTEPPAPTTTTTQPVPGAVEPVAPDTPVVDAPAPATPAPAPAEVPVTNVSAEDELAFGGSWSGMLAMIGIGLGLIGIAFRLYGRSLGSQV